MKISSVSYYWTDYMIPKSVQKNGQFRKTGWNNIRPFILAPHRRYSFIHASKIITIPRETVINPALFPLPSFSLTFWGLRSSTRDGRGLQLFLGLYGCWADALGYRWGWSWRRSQIQGQLTSASADTPTLQLLLILLCCQLLQVFVSES